MYSTNTWINRIYDNQNSIQNNNHINIHSNNWLKKTDSQISPDC